MAKLPIILDTNVFIWLSNKNAKFRIEPISQKFLNESIKSMIIWRNLGVPAIVPHELKRKDVCDKTGNAENIVVKNIFEKHPEWVLDIDNQTFEYIGKLNDLLKDHKDAIKYQDKIIIALGLQHFWDSFSVLTTDYADFIKPFIPRWYVTIEKTIWMLTREEIIEQDKKVCDKYKSENMYLLNYDFSTPS